MVKYIAAWMLLLITAFANAIIRELTYAPHLGGGLANQVSVFTGIVLLGCAIWLIVAKWPFASTRQAVYVGLVWAAMTEVFEFSMVCVYMGKPWSFFLGMHNVLQAELWPLVVIWLGVAPWLIWQWRTRRRS